MSHSIICYAQKGKRQSHVVLEAFARGCGGRVVEGVTELLPGDAVFYGIMNETVPLYHAAKAAGKDVFYLDHGYFRADRFFRATKNADQYMGGGAVRHVAYQRWRDLGITIKPWQRNEAGHVLVTLQSPMTFEARGESRVKWLENVTTVLWAATHREIRVRDKPTIKKPQPRTFTEDLAGAWALVARSSNTAVMALLEGIPAFVTHACAASYCASADLGMIEDPFFPDDREDWAALLAGQQWTLDEMERGEAWEALNV